MKKVLFILCAVVCLLGLTACGSNVSYESSKAQTSIENLTKTINYVEGLENLDKSERQRVVFNLKSSLNHLKALVVQLDRLKTSQERIELEADTQYISGQLDGYILLLQGEIRIANAKCEYYMQKYS